MVNLSTEHNSIVLRQGTVGGLVKGKGCVGGRKMKGGASVGMLNKVESVLGPKAGHGGIVSQQNCGRVPRPSGLGAGQQLGGNGGVGFGFDAAEASKNGKLFAGSYMPVEAVDTRCGSQSGGKTHKRKHAKKAHKGKTHKRKHSGGKHKKGHKGHKKTHKNAKKHRAHKRRTMKGGYTQFMSNTPNTPGYGMPNVSAMPGVANGSPTPLTRQVNCVDNYNHMTGKGAVSPVLDQAN